jgi:AcrR family transcriptional regulator
MQAFGALNLQPMPVDPLEHLRVGYLKTRPYLERLRRHDPSRTSRISERDGYVYPMTPRKILRRVLDHTLDHLNQIDQWIDWQSVGAKPRPTDGWAPSGITFDEDHVPLTEDELSAWLWRIDRAIELLIHRAARLSEEELAWQPPDDSWPLQRVLHHVARSYGYAVWLDEALPEDAQQRYLEANRRFTRQVVALVDEPPTEAFGFYRNAGREFTVAEMIEEVLAAEEEVRSTGELAPVVSEID